MADSLAIRPQHGSTYLYRVGAMLLDRNDPSDVIGYTPHFIFGPENFSTEAAIRQRLDKTLKLDDSAFVDSVFAVKETTIRATSRLLDSRKTEDIVSINKQVVETIFSQEAIGKQIYDLITAS